MTVSSGGLIGQLQTIVGRRHVIVDRNRMRQFSTGYRGDSGPLLAVVRPGSLIEQWRTLITCVQADVIVIAQAANTGLTGGSTPFGKYDRPVVVINTMRIKGIHLIREGQQAVCLSGATLNELEQKLAPLAREPHSIIGSSCIGASVVGGICNNSGGALVRRGPAYTQYAVYAQVDAAGQVQLCNRLGVTLGHEPEAMLERLESGDFSDQDITPDDRAASAVDYGNHVRNVGAQSAARFNADPSRLFEASGSAGKLMVFAVRVDSFPKDHRTATFYIGTNDPNELTMLRRRLLTECDSLPITGEYIHRDAFDLAAHYGKDTFLAIQHFGTARLPTFFGLKSRFDALSSDWRFLPRHLSDRLLQWVSRAAPQHLPRRMIDFRDRFAHHLILKMGDEGIEQARKLLASIFPNASGDMFECDPIEENKAFLHRFAVAGAAVRYRALHENVAEIIALDVALKRSDTNWFEDQLPAAAADSVVKAIYYGHFFCHVFHQDYLIRRGANSAAVKELLLSSLNKRGAQYPAEHNVGHLYVANSLLAAHYRELDPGNRLNPGIGKTSRNRNWS